MAEGKQQLANVSMESIGHVNCADEDPASKALRDKKLRPEYRCSIGMRIITREEGNTKKATS